MVKIEYRMATQSPCYVANRWIKPVAPFLHSVGCPQPDPDVWADIFSRPNHDSSFVGAFIGEDKVVVIAPILDTPGKTLRLWHCGGDANNTHIGIEMCEPDCIRYTHGATFDCWDLPRAREFVRHTTQNAVEFFALLCRFHSLDPDKIISHREGAALGIASHHADPSHLWDQLGLNYTMDDFRREVAEEIEKGDINMAVKEIMSAKDDAIKEINDREDRAVTAIKSAADNLDMTRSEVVEEAVRAVEKKNRTYATVADVPSHYRPFVDQLIDLGLLNGRSGTGESRKIDMDESGIRTLTVLARMIAMGTEQPEALHALAASVNQAKEDQ